MKLGPGNLEVGRAKRSEVGSRPICKICFQGRINYFEMSLSICSLGKPMYIAKFELDIILRVTAEKKQPALFLSNQKMLRRNILFKDSLT